MSVQPKISESQQITEQSAPVVSGPATVLLKAASVWLAYIANVDTSAINRQNAAKLMVEIDAALAGVQP